PARDPRKSIPLLPQPPAYLNSHTPAPFPAIPSTQCASSQKPRLAAHSLAPTGHRTTDSHFPAASAPPESPATPAHALLARQTPAPLRFPALLQRRATR